MNLILASASPRRQSLLREAGFSFIVHPAAVDEEDHPPGLPASALAAYLAAAKADAVAQSFPNDLVLGADTVVALGDRCLGKPENPTDAYRMLADLAGTTHHVITAVSIRCAARELAEDAIVYSTVQMRPLTSEEIQAYIVGGEWRGKAGGYGIQDPDPFVSRMGGSLSNIVGLPMETVTPMLRRAGIGT